MSVQVKELVDGQYVGLGVFEIAAFPILEGDNISYSLEESYNAFTAIIEGFYRISENCNHVAELLWIVENAEKQTFKSHIRIMCVIRKISNCKNGLLKEVEELLKYFSFSFSSRQFKIDNANDIELLESMVAGVDDSCVLSICKSEQCIGNLSSIYPYYYADIIPSMNIDNYSTMISTLSRYEHCCISFQLFPANYTIEERMYLNEVLSEMGRIRSGIMTSQGMYQDVAAEEPYKMLAKYNELANSSLFHYNILIFGEREDCVSLSTRVINLLQAGKSKVMKANFECYDMSEEKVSILEELWHYPWNINNSSIYKYRNERLLNSVPMAKALFRLPYFISSQEAASFFRLPYREKNMASLKENRVKDNLETLDGSITSSNSIRFGKMIVSEFDDISIGCPENLFTKHTLIVGTPGSGKTTFSINLLLQFAEKNIPFLVIEPTKNEYRALISRMPNIQIFTPGNNVVSPYIINPFTPPSGITVEKYIPSLLSAFKAAFSMPSPLDILFLKAVKQCYYEYGWKDYSLCTDKDVEIFGLFEFVIVFKKIVSESRYSGEIKGNLESAGVFRLTNLLEQNSNIFDTVNTIPIEDILQKPTIVELNSIDNVEQKALIIALLLINIGVYVKNNHQGDGKLKNIMMIDEAHVLLGGNGLSTKEGVDSQGATIKSLQDMIAEIRSYGTGIIIADQSPSKVSREVIANTDIKISFRLVQASEKNLMCDSMGMEQTSSQYLSRLKPGEAYVYFSKLENPLLVVTEDVRKKEGIRLVVSDEEIVSKMTYWNKRGDLLNPFHECKLCKDCASGCDFKLRSKADYYANKLLMAYGSKINEKKDLLLYLTTVEQSLVKVLEDFDKKQRNQIINCATIRFARKVQIYSSLRVSKSEIMNILVMERGQYE